MKPTEPLQETLYSEMLGRIKETDIILEIEGQNMKCNG
jgi:protease II